MPGSLASTNSSSPAVSARSSANLSHSGANTGNMTSVMKRLGRKVTLKRLLSLSGSQTSGEVTESELQHYRHRPASMEHLLQITKFDKRELKLLYRGFKDFSPTGLVTFETFRDIFSQLFPQGDPSHYAAYVFATFDKDSNGQISFEEFVVGLSTFCRGTMEQKFQWIFSLYDLNGNGELTRAELNIVVSSIYDMIGKNAYPPVTKDTVSRHVDDILKKIDPEHKDCITLNEFMIACSADEVIRDSMQLFETKF